MLILVGQGTKSVRCCVLKVMRCGRCLRVRRRPQCCRLGCAMGDAGSASALNFGISGAISWYGTAKQFQLANFSCQPVQNDQHASYSVRGLSRHRVARMSAGASSVSRVAEPTSRQVGRVRILEG